MASKKTEKTPDIRIVIAQRGFVYLGEYERVGDRVTVKRGFNVRRWGTSKGLGELAMEGAKQNTVLDPTPDIEMHDLSVVNTIVCNPEPWAGKLR